MSSHQPNQAFIDAVKSSIDAALSSSLDSTFSQYDGSTQIKLKAVSQDFENNLMITVGSILFRLVVFVSYADTQQFGAILRKEISENDHDHTHRIHETFAEFCNLMVGDLKRRMGDFIGPLGMSTPVKLDSNAIELCRQYNTEQEISIDTAFNDDVMLSVKAYLKAFEDLDQHMSYAAPEVDAVMDGELELF